MKSFTANDNPSHKGNTNTWFTPLWIIDSLGFFDLDPCTESTKPFSTAKKHYYYDKGQDGLKLKWNGFVFVNPPYGIYTKIWLDKLSSYNNGIALVFSRTGTRWMQKALRDASAILFLKGRVQFI